MTKFDHKLFRLQMTTLELVIFSCVTSTMEKITNLTMNLYFLLNSNTADGFRDPINGKSESICSVDGVSESIYSVRI